MNMEKYEDVKTQSIDNKIFCYCTYEFKDTIKRLGFRWDNNLKLWYIPKKKFTKDVFRKSRKVRFRNFTTVGTLDYFYVYYKSKDEINDMKDESDEDEDLDDVGEVCFF